MTEVAICIVSHNSGDDLEPCLESVASLRRRPAKVVVVDSASTDESVEIARGAGAGLPLEVLPLPSNAGFSAAMNVAISETTAPFVVSLNPDARPDPEFLDHLLDRLERSRDDKVGAVTGRLVRLGSQEPRVLDAAGMRLGITWRHFDRGSDQIDDGQYSDACRVFGATGAATLFVRQALEDVSIDGECFLEEFHSFREDAELAFRLRERGWEILYEPRANCLHRRSNLPHRRRQMPPEVNFHTLKNRYLLRLYHQSAGNFLLTLVPTLARDLGIAGYVLARERSSLPAYRWLWQNRRRLWQRRRAIQDRRLVPSRAIDGWFFRSSASL